MTHKSQSKIYVLSKLSRISLMKKRFQVAIFSRAFFLLLENKNKKKALLWTLTRAWKAYQEQQKKKRCRYKQDFYLDHE